MTPPNWDHVPHPTIRKVLTGVIVNQRDLEEAVIDSQAFANTKKKEKVWQKADSALFHGEYPRLVKQLRKLWSK